MTFSNFTYKRVNYKKIYSLANELLATSHAINDFPFSINKFIKEQSDIKLCTFQKAKDKWGISIPMFGSESAVIQEYQGMNIIFYNQDEPVYRIRFSCMHEFGHKVLNHKMNLSKDDPLYQLQELETNCFAAQMLMPEQIIRECQFSRYKKITDDLIINAFSVSPDAARRRLNTLAKTHNEWRSREERTYDDIILTKFANKINSIAPPLFNSYDFEAEYERQCTRDVWEAIP